MTKTNVLHVIMLLALATTVNAKSQLESSGEPQRTSPQLTSVNRLPNLFIIGDSTASNSADLGWGSHLADYFDTEKISVFNRARGGRSSRTFQTEGLWDKVLEALQPGDVVLI